MRTKRFRPDRFAGDGLLAGRAVQVVLASLRDAPAGLGDNPGVSLRSTPGQVPGSPSGCVSHAEGVLANWAGVGERSEPPLVSMPGKTAPRQGCEDCKPRQSARFQGILRSRLDRSALPEGGIVRLNQGHFNIEPCGCALASLLLAKAWAEPS